MMMIQFALQDFLLLDLVVGGVAVLVFLLCAAAAIKRHDAHAASFLIPSLYFAFMYFWIHWGNPDDLLRRVLLRIGVFTTLVIIGIWAVFHILNIKKPR